MEFIVLLFPAYEIIRWIAPFVDTLESKWSDPRHPHEELIDFVTELFYREFVFGVDLRSNLPQLPPGLLF